MKGSLNEKIQFGLEQIFDRTSFKVIALVEIQAIGGGLFQFTLHQPLWRFI